MSNTAKAILVLCVVVGIYKLLHLHGAVRMISGPDEITAVSLHGQKATQGVFHPRDKPYLALYHGASWCPPCQAFSPTLAQFYHDADKSKFQLIMVNYDRSQEDMIDYMKEHVMEFPAIREGDAGKWAAATGDGIPNLIIIDTATGKVLDSSYSGSDYKGPNAPLDTLRGLIR